MCETRILSWNGNTHISHCTKCRTIFLWHQNVMMSFTLEEFSTFRKAMNKLEFSDCALPFPDEVERVVVCTPESNINLAFDKVEWTSLKNSMDESYYIQEIFELMNM